jgi:hypothetical protein
MEDFKKLIKEAYLGNPLNENLIKEITLAGGDYSDSYGNNQAEEQLTTPEDYEIFIELFPQGEASRILMDPKRKELYDQHLEWTKDSQYNNTFEHMQYHIINHDGEVYKAHQTQYYNGNYKDFRNPRFTELMISKDGKRMGTYLVDTTEYIKDLNDLESQGKLGVRVSESLNEEDRATRVDKMLSGKYDDEDYKDSKRYDDVRADLEAEMNEEISDELKAKYDDAAMDEYGKPFAELDIAQKQELMRAIIKWTGKEFETDFTRRRKETSDYMNEALDPKDFPANFFYGGKIYVFDRIAGGDRAVYYNPKYKGDYLAFGSKKQMEDYLGDYVEPKGGTQSSHFGTNEDINDPVLMKTRASQMKRDKIEADEKAKQSSLDKRYGSSFMDKLDAEIDLKQELQDLKDEREQLMIDMEQEAEPEGGEIADLYGMKLNRIDLRTAEIKSELEDLRMYESVDEGTCGYGEDGIIGDKPAGPDLNEDEIDEEIETSLTPNEIGDEAVERESDSAAYESLQGSLRKKLQERLK